MELNCGTHDIEKNHIPDFCMCLRPDLIGEIGYFSEENYYGHIELSYRVCRFTGYKAGFIPDVHILLPGFVPCGECLYKDKCRLGSGGCFAKYRSIINEEFLENKWGFEETVRDMVWRAPGLLRRFSIPRRQGTAYNRNGLRQNQHGSRRLLRCGRKRSGYEQAAQSMKFLNQPDKGEEVHPSCQKSP